MGALARGSPRSVILLHAMKSATRVALHLSVALLLSAGCSHYRAANQALQHYDPDYGYRPKTHQTERPAGDVWLLLAFSGGGTRAASLSYGVLQELRDTRIGAAGSERRLLDETDLVTGISGGSFTAAYYGLYGDRIFEDFEARFLRRNVQRQLIWEFLRPKNWLKMVFTFFDRTELAIRLYDRDIFDGATFADLQKAGGPFIQINAADLAVGNRFTFFQPQFDLICSDLSTIEIARAVAASSAVPVAFNPVTLRNYAGTCGYEPPAWFAEALADRKGSLRRFRSAQIAESYLDAEKRKYLHLSDGGIADNLGLRGPLDNVLLVGGIQNRLDMLQATRPRHLVVVVVNAEVHPEPPFNLVAAAPGIASMLNAVSGVQIYAYNFETLELMRESLKAWADDLSKSGPPVSSHLVEVAFDSEADAEERSFLNELPTSFHLDDPTVDRVIEAGRRLLRESPAYQELLGELR